MTIYFRLPIDIYIRDKGYKYALPRMPLNYLKLPVNQIPISDAGMDEFNRLLEVLEESNYEYKIVRTPSGGISISQQNLHVSYDISVKRYGVEVTVIGICCARFQFRASKKESGGIYGHQAWTEFNKICEKFNIDLKGMAINNGEEVKQTIPSPKIELNENYKELLMENVNHIDIHSAYMGAIAENFPELRPAIEYIYNGRKEKAINKAILTHTYGYMQSKGTNYRYSHMSKAAVETTIKKLETLSKKLKESGRRVVAFNTDGIWYVGEPYHGDGEGKGLGQWSNDHVNCKAYFKSKGIYCYIENDIFTAVARGRFKLDQIKPRDQWTLHDIMHMNEQPYKYEFVPNEKGFGRIQKVQLSKLDIIMEELKRA